jgi:hypothetical protein
MFFSNIDHFVSLILNSVDIVASEIIFFAGIVAFTTLLFLRHLFAEKFSLLFAVV